MSNTKCVSCNSSFTRNNSGITCTFCSKSHHWWCANAVEKNLRESGELNNWQWAKCVNINAALNQNKYSRVDGIISDLKSQGGLVIENKNSITKVISQFYGKLQDNKRFLTYSRRSNKIEDDVKFNYCGIKRPGVDITEHATLSNSVGIVFIL